MGILHQSAPSLGFFGDDLDPEEITRLLGGSPDFAARKGAPWLTASGAERIALRGSWRLQAARCEPGDLDGQITRLLAGLNDDLPAWRMLAARFRGRIFCGLFLTTENEGLTLTPPTLALIAERGLHLDFDIYDQSMD